MKLGKGLASILVVRRCATLLVPLGVWGACSGAEFKDSEDGENDAGAPASGGTTTAGRGGSGGSGAVGEGGNDVGGESSGGDAGSGARASGGSTSTGGTGEGGTDPTGGSGGNQTGGAGSGNGGSQTGGAGSGNGGSQTGGAGSGNGGSQTGGAGSGNGGSGGAGSGGSAGSATYADVQLITSCSGPRGEVYDGAWYGGAGGASTFSPAHSEGAFPMSGAGYISSGARIWGTMAQGDYAHVGHNMYRGAALFNASAYAGVSFWARAAAAINVRVGLGQQNNDPGFGVCTPDVTCYKYPEVTIRVATTWTRYVALFSDMQTSPPGIVPTTPATMKHIQFSMEAGAYDFTVDELYFVARQ